MRPGALALALALGCVASPCAGQEYVTRDLAGRATHLLRMPSIPVPAARSACPWDAASAVRWDVGDAGTPATGSDVAVPSGTTVVLGGGSHTYGRITIPAGSTLAFADESVHLTVSGIRIEGSLSIGSETCRADKDATITLTGTTDSIVDEVSKGIVVEPGAMLDLHGDLWQPTWTRLAKTASSGDSSIFLQVHRTLFPRERREHVRLTQVLHVLRRTAWTGLSGQTW